MNAEETMRYVMYYIFNLYRIVAVKLLLDSQRDEVQIILSKIMQDR